MRKSIRIAALFLLALGVVLFLYPSFIRANFYRKSDNTIDEFRRLSQRAISEDAFTTGDSKLQEREIALDKLQKAMAAYNKRLYLSGQSSLIDQLSYETPDFSLMDYGIESEVLGYIEIPAIGVRLPVYNGASTDNMAKGAVYLAHTSLPLGGENTNCVIAAHSQFNGIYVFKRITELKPGDEIRFTNLWETLTYRVAETKIIDPSDSGSIYIQEGRCLLTLSTCHPFPQNYQRYLVYAELSTKN